MSENVDHVSLADKRDKQLKWNGWGYADSRFYVDDKARVVLSGNRYEMSGRPINDLATYMRDMVNAQLYHFDFGEIAVKRYPDPVVNEQFLTWLNENAMKFSTDAQRRVNRSHGHNITEVMRLRMGQCEKRIPDIIVWPKNHEEVVHVVKAANDMNVVIIPFGGGTNVSGALCCPLNEKRCIVSLDMCDMNKLLWVDDKNFMARAECGIIGGSLEKQLNEKGFTIGHEPDSIEFSSLGGWIATRASGIKKNKYGNIEDIIVNITVVTSKGVLVKFGSAPRISAGPDIHHFIIGSEGTLGVITEATFKIWPLPKCRKFGSILFPTFENGVKALREMARQKIYPASIRLMDNEQFKFSQALRPDKTRLTEIADVIKYWYLSKVKKFDPDKMAPATLLFEGAKEEVELQEKKVYKIASEFGGFKAGTEHGRYGYNLTFYIAYIRDIAIDYCGIGESFETSVPWDKVEGLCRNVKEACVREITRLGATEPGYACCRVTQLYDSGACVYFYCGFNYRSIAKDDELDRRGRIEKAVHLYEHIETVARNEILNCGGSISHHHGVGKIRSRWLPRTIGAVGLSALKAVKDNLDPNNVFACGNLYTFANL